MTWDRQRPRDGWADVFAHVAWRVDVAMVEIIGHRRFVSNFGGMSLACGGLAVLPDASRAIGTEGRIEVLLREDWGRDRVHRGSGNGVIDRLMYCRR